MHIVSFTSNNRSERILTVEKEISLFLAAYAIQTQQRYISKGPAHMRYNAHSPLPTFGYHVILQSPFHDHLHAIFNISHPHRPPRPVTGIALLYFLHDKNYGNWNKKHLPDRMMC
jgi:hypothetical protein